MEIKKIGREIFQIVTGLVVCFPFLAMHAYSWFLYSETFISKILIWCVLLLTSWIVARLFSKLLTRFTDSSNLLFHMAITALFVSWIPFFILVGVNFKWADKATHTITLPVATRGVETTRNGDSTHGHYVKVKHNFYKKLFYANEQFSHLPLYKIDSLKLHLSKGYLGFEIIREVEYIPYSDLNH